MISFEKITKNKDSIMIQCHFSDLLYQNNSNLCEFM
jgi:hypothetical protein